MIPMKAAFSLTDEQQAVVQHDAGAAVVHAVAGAGKTTAMVQRIARLVRERKFRANRILATSFSRDTVLNLKRSLESFQGCHDVSTRTLHSVGMKVIQLAEQLQLIPKNNNPQGEMELLSKALIRKAVKKARICKLEWARELEQFDEDDFEGFIGTCKGNLEYANLSHAPILESLKTLAKQASAPLGLEWYLDLFVIYEEIRLEERLLTFDDMLLGAWEVLVMFDEVRTQVQAMFDCVLVDEFQDVNLVQSELLDLITKSHGNYMVIGDDDQTIYEWRGASPKFILEFSKRYDAKKYIISDNFRCTASQVVLANRVIVHNKQRQNKHLSLTKGFQGSTHWHHEATTIQQALTIVNEAVAARDAGTKLGDMAILVRSYAQTPDIETALEKENIPYRIIGATPFFERLEIKTFLAYLRLTLVENRLILGQPLSVEQIEIFSSSLKLVMNRPTRYVSNEFTERVALHVLQTNTSIARTIAALAVGQGNSSSRLLHLAKLIEWLEQNLEQPVKDVLVELERRLEYKKFLLHSSAFEEIGEGKVRSIEAFIMHTARFPNILELIRSIARFEKRYQQYKDSDPQDTLSILSIHRAKGLEWDVVFVPDLNEGYIPFGQPSEQNRVEEERRLLYVAITRAKRDLHLLSVKEAPISRFLEEARIEQSLSETQVLRETLDKDPMTWTAKQALALVQAKNTLNLERYFLNWWDEPVEKIGAIALQAQRLIRQTISKKLVDLFSIKISDQDFWAKFDPLDEHDQLEVFSDLEAPVVQTVIGDTQTLGAKVYHKKFGVGKILEVRGANAALEVVVAFEGVGTKRLLHRFAQLERAT